MQLPSDNYSELAAENIALQQRVAALEAELAAAREAHTQLRGNQGRFQLFITQAPTAVAMFDREMRYLAVSRRWMQDFHLQEAVIGRSHYQVFPEIPERWKAIHRRCLAGAVERSDEDAFVRADGSTDWIRWEVRPWYDAAGAVGGIVVFSEDITAQKQAEQGLQRSEALYRAIARNLPDAGVLVVGPDLRYLLAEGPAIARLGLSRAQLEGYSPEQVFEPEAAAKALHGFRTALDGQELAIERVYADHVLWTSYVPLRDEHGQVQFAMALILDITERRRLETQLLQAQKMESVGQLAGGIAHDFNNLLTAIGGYAELVLGALGPDDPSRADLVEIQRATERATSLTRQLLAFARRQRLAMRSLDLGELVRNLERLLRRLIGEQIQLVVRVEPGLGQVLADPGQIEQVLVNLAINARDAMPGSGTLTIELDNIDLGERFAYGYVDLAAGAYVMIAVSDSGVGIPPEIQPHLFEPFFTTKPPGQGSGLGLATSYGIVKQHGGAIWVSSEVGRGTAVKIYLPRHHAPPADQRPAEELGQLPSGSETVLLVEDEPAVRALAARVLRACGYTVIEAADGEAAVRAAQQHAPEPLHLLISDVVMPHLGGPETAAQIRAIYPNIAVLFMSGYTGIDPAGSCEMPEPDAPLIQKPFSAGVLANAVRIGLGR